MSETTEKPALTWRQRLATWGEVAQSTLSAAWSWIKGEPTVFLVLCVVAIVAAMFTKVLWDTDLQASRNTAHAAPDWNEQARQLDARIAALEAAQTISPAVAPPTTIRARQRLPVTREAPTPAPVEAEPATVPALPPITRQSINEYRAQLRGEE